MPQPVSGVESRSMRLRIAFANFEAQRLLPVSWRLTRQPANSFTSAGDSSRLNEALVYRAQAAQAAGFATELLEIELAAGSSIDYEIPPVRGLEHHLLMRAGRLRLTLEGQTHELRAGDTLSYKLFGASRYEAVGASAARYLLALTPPR